MCVVTGRICSVCGWVSVVSRRCMWLVGKVESIVIINRKCVCVFYGYG